jgi:hypothetical protein
MPSPSWLAFFSHGMLLPNWLAWHVAGMATTFAAHGIAWQPVACICRIGLAAYALALAIACICHPGMA